MKRVVFFLCLFANLCWGWGEVGHHIIARSAVEILKNHPLFVNASIPIEKSQPFLSVFKSKQYQQGHLANIPDTYWRNLESPWTEAGTMLGAPTHYFNSEALLVQLKRKDLNGVEFLLNYMDTEHKLKSLPHFFKTVGSLPWRAQQFTDLYSQSLQSQTNLKCSESQQAQNNTRNILTFAGLMAHFTGDVTMPYHTSLDHDAISVGQKGLHSYFEQDLVNELEKDSLFAKVTQRAESLLSQSESKNGTPSLQSLHHQAAQLYPNQLSSQRTVALMLTIATDSLSKIEKLRQLDYTYAIASLKEALTMPECQNLSVVKGLKEQYEKLETQDQRSAFENVKVLSYPSSYDDKKAEPACRRPPSARVDEDGHSSPDGKTVAQWHESLIVDRLALAAVLTADIWTEEWKKANAPALCSTYLYAHKPSFISPTETKCSGYALKEPPDEFTLPKGKNALTQKFPHSTESYCLSF